MKSSLDCIPCFLRQALEAARLASSSSAVHEQVLREVLRWTAEMDVEHPAPVATLQIHRLIRALTGVADHLGVPVGAHVLARSGAKTAGKGVAS